jgi:hypothetical protein
MPPNIQKYNNVQLIIAIMWLPLLLLLLQMHGMA